jgi:predicted nucleic acid-binding protein
VTRAFFVDTNVVVYAGSPDDERHSACTDLLSAIASGHAMGLTSVSVVEEVWHLELSGRVPGAAGLAARTYRLFTPLLPVTDETVSAALQLEPSGLGANDRIHVATCLENGIDTIVTADSEFDGIRGLRRTDPLDARAVRRLLGR